ncbi:hypothetical protein Tco_0920529, partial [Tanacetum coccineum]
MAAADAGGGPAIGPRCRRWPAGWVWPLISWPGRGRGDRLRGWAGAPINAEKRRNGYRSNSVRDIPRLPKPVMAISIHCDSKSAMGRAQSTMYNGKSRHIRRRHNSILQLLSTGFILIDYVASKDNIVDPFTKGLSRELVNTTGTKRISNDVIGRLAAATERLLNVKIEKIVLDSKAASSLVKPNKCCRRTRVTCNTAASKQESTEPNLLLEKVEILMPFTLRLQTEVS